MQKLLNLVDAAKLLNISAATLRRLAKAGKIRYVRPTGAPNGPIMFRPEDLEAWVSACEDAAFWALSAAEANSVPEQVVIPGPGVA